MRFRLPSGRIASSPGSPAWAACRSFALSAPPHLVGSGLLLALCLFTAAARADTVYLKGGQILHLEACRRQAAELRCARAGGLIGIPLDQVERIEKGSSAPARRAAPAPRGRSPEPLPPVIDPAGFPPGGAELTPEAARARIDALDRRAPRPVNEAAAARRELSLLHAYLGNAAMMSRDYEGALAHYQEALEQDPALTAVRLNRAAALINLNRHQAAEDLLRALLSEHPDDARALDLLGEASFQTGRVDEAIRLWERSLALEPRETLQARLARARRLLQAEEGYERSDAAHFTLTFDGEEASQELAAEILSYLEESFAVLSARFAHYPEGLIRVTLYSKEAFHEATASPDWVGGLFDGQLRVPVRGLTHLTPRARRVLMHELTHCFVASKSRGNAPQWIQEGIAQVMEGKTASSQRIPLRQAYEALGGPAGAAEFSYPRALSQVEHFLATWSESHFNDLLDLLGRGNDIDAAMRAAIGLTYKEFLSSWGDSLGG